MLYDEIIAVKHWNIVEEEHSFKKTALDNKWLGVIGGKNWLV